MELLILILATYRLAQIIAQDVISEPVRAWISKRGTATMLLSGDEPPPADLRITRQRATPDGVETDYWTGLAGWLAMLVNCVICVSVWAGLGLAALWAYLPGSRFLVYGLAASGGAIIIGSALAAANARRQP